MALRYRNNVNILPLISNCRSQVQSKTAKKQRYAFVNGSDSPHQHRSYSRNQSSPIQPRSFAEFINTQRAQASRSILVQVQTTNAYPTLRQFLQNYGLLEAAFHYQINSNHFILVEFANESSAYDVINSATFLDRSACVPVRSNFLWYRCGRGGSQNTEGPYKKPQLVRGSMSNSNLYNIVNSIFSKNLDLCQQMLHFQSQVELQQLDLRLRFLIAWQLENLFCNVFDGCKVVPFGSSVNSYGKHACDLDLVLNLEDRMKGNNQPDNGLMLQAKPIVTFDNSFVKNFLDTMGSMMQYCIPGAAHVKKILNARVPIIKYKHDFTGLQCDLSVLNITPFYMSELLWLFGKADHRVRPVVYTIRYWAEVNSMTRDSPGPWITNFSLTLLVLFFFQSIKILPTLRLLHSNAAADDVRFVGNIDCTFPRDPFRFPVNLQMKNEPLDQLLAAFFDFYMSFDFYTKAVDLRSGQPSSKRSSSPMYIINPLEPQLNVSKNVSVVEVDKFKGFCSEAKEIIKSEPANSPYILLRLFKRTELKPKMVQQKSEIQVETLLSDSETKTTLNTGITKQNVGGIARLKYK